MSNLLRTDSFELSGRTFQIRVLGFDASRKAYAILHRALAVLGDKDVAEVGSLLMASITGVLSEKEIEELVKIFGEVTIVDFNDADEKRSSRRLKPTEEAVLNELFAGQYEDVFVWLEKCIDLNFANIKAKMAGALELLAKKAEAKKASKAEPN